MFQNSLKNSSSNNLDIQFCYDGYAVVTYITDYLSKGDAGITSALKKAFKESKFSEAFDTCPFRTQCHIIIFEKVEKSETSEVPSL